MKRVFALMMLTAFLGLFLVAPVGAQELDPVQLAITTAIASSSPPFRVNPAEFDPNRTDLVRSAWLTGTGCPTGATAVDFFGTASTVTDPACPTGDPKDKRNEGLLLVKTGPTSNFASAVAEVKGVKGITLTEIGYDIRTGSHCGAGAPRFNVLTTGSVNHFVGCASPPPMVAGTSLGWKRLRWTTVELLAAFPPILPTDVVEAIFIVFDEGQDVSGGPDFSGAAIIDNIDINSQLVGEGPGN